MADVAAPLVVGSDGAKTIREAIRAATMERHAGAGNMAQVLGAGPDDDSP